MALGLAIDANRYVDFRRGDSLACDVIAVAPRVMLPFVVVAELRAGFRGGNRPAENERLLLEFLRSPRVSVVFADDVTTHMYAELAVTLHKAGTPIPKNDMWIAAIVLQHDLVLFSRDRHFDAVPRIARM